MALFAALGLLAMLASPRWSVRLSWLLLALMLGAAIELGEAIRYAGLLEWYDVLTDADGVAAGVLVGALVAWLSTRAQEDRR